MDYTVITTNIKKYIAEVEIRYDTLAKLTCRPQPEITQILDLETGFEVQDLELIARAMGKSLEFFERYDSEPLEMGDGDGIKIKGVLSEETQRDANAIFTALKIYDDLSSVNNQ